MYHQFILYSTLSYPFTKQLLVGHEMLGDCLYPRSFGPVGTKSDCNSFAWSCEAVCFSRKTSDTAVDRQHYCNIRCNKVLGLSNELLPDPPMRNPIARWRRIAANPRFKRRTSVEVSLVRRSRLPSNVACQVLKHNIVNDQKRDLGNPLWRVLSIVHRA